MYIIHGINKQNATGFTRLKFLYFEISKFIAMISYSFSAQKLMRTLFKNYLLVSQLNGKQTNRLLLQCDIKHLCKHEFSSFCAL